MTKGWRIVDIRVGKGHEYSGNRLGNICGKPGDICLGHGNIHRNMNIGRYKHTHREHMKGPQVHREVEWRHIKGA